ncbi:MAG: hypothetical protein ACYDBX_03805 [Patescibacteria group bacterium]
MQLLIVFIIVLIVVIPFKYLTDVHYKYQILEKSYGKDVVNWTIKEWYRKNG